MTSESTTIRVTRQSREALRQISEATGKKQQDVVDAAVEAYRRQLLLDRANEAYAALRKDSAAWKSERAERAVWDATLSDGQEKDYRVEQPSRGQVWQVDLSPTQGRETRGTRPCLVITVDRFNHGPAGLVVVLPITTKAKGVPFHVPVDPPEGGLDKRSYIKCEEPRCISTDRLTECLGAVAPETMEQVADLVRILLGL